MTATTNVDQFVRELAAETPKHVSTSVDVARSGAAPSWMPTPILDRLADTDAVPYPVLYFRDDGRGILYPGLVHSVIGQPEAGKTMFCVAAAHATLRDGQRVAFLDLEMNESAVVERLRLLGTTDTELGDFLYARPEEPILPAHATLERIAALRPALVVIDSMNVALGMEGLDPNSTPDVTLWVQRVARYLATHSGAAVLYPDHVTKNSETRGTWAFGSQAKAAAVDVVISMRNEMPFGKGRTGRSSITVMKDRYGDLRGMALNGKTLASFVLTSDDGLHAELLAPADTADFRPTFLMERVSRYLEDQLESKSQRAITENVAGKATYVRTALALLIEDGYVATEPGPRGAALHRSIRPFRESTKSTASRPRPDAPSDRVPTASPTNPCATTAHDRVPTASRPRPDDSDDRVPDVPPVTRRGDTEDAVPALFTSLGGEVVEERPTPRQRARERAAEAASDD